MAPNNRTKVVGECVFNVATFSEGEAARNIALVLQNCPDKNAYIELGIRMAKAPEARLDSGMSCEFSMGSFCSTFRSIDESIGSQVPSKEPQRRRDNSSDHAMQQPQIKRRPQLASNKFGCTQQDLKGLLVAAAAENSSRTLKDGGGRPVLGETCGIVNCLITPQSVSNNVTKEDCFTGAMTQRVVDRGRGMMVKKENVVMMRSREHKAQSSTTLTCKTERRGSVCVSL